MQTMSFNDLEQGTKVKLTADATKHYQALSNWYEITAYYDKFGTLDPQRHSHPFFDQEYESRDVRMYQIREDGGKNAIFMIYDWDIESLL